jgi:hypothetical protein
MPVWANLYQIQAVSQCRGINITRASIHTDLQLLPLQCATLVTIVPAEEVSVQRRCSRPAHAEREATAAAATQTTSCGLRVTEICMRATPATGPAAWAAAARVAQAARGVDDAVA